MLTEKGWGHLPLLFHLLLQQLGGAGTEAKELLE